MKNNLEFSILLISISLILSACSQSRSQHQGSDQFKIQSYEKGTASYYADKYQGRQTANGEHFDQNAKTAAHQTLKFGTWVKVTSVADGRSVIVRVNDRGPFVKGRIIDLSKSSFSAIADVRLGVVNVVVEVLSR